MWKGLVKMREVALKMRRAVDEVPKLVNPSPVKAFFPLPFVYCLFSLLERSLGQGVCQLLTFLSITHCDAVDTISTNRCLLVSRGGHIILGRSSR